MLITRNKFDEFKKLEEQGILPSHEEFKELSEIVKKKFFDSVVSNLRFQAESMKETDILELLNNLRFTIKPHVELDPDPGISYISRDRKYIDISLMDVSRSVAVSKFAAIILAGSEREGDIAYNIGFNYAQEIARFLDHGDKPLWPSVDYNQLDIHPSYQEGLKEYSSYIHWEYLTWLLLHEMGHHVLQHFDDSDEESLEQLRQKEKEAEIWAFDRMNTLGYSLPLVYNYMLANTAFEIIRFNAEAIIAEAIPSETESAHLSWNTRTQIMQDYLEQVSPVNNKWIFLNFSSMAKGHRTDSEIFVTYNLIYPLTIEKQGNLCYLTIEEGKTEFLYIMVIEYENDEAHLYSLNIEGYYIHIKNPFAFSPEVKVSISIAKGDRINPPQLDYTNPNDAVLFSDVDEKFEYNFIMNRFSIAAIYDYEKMGIKIRDMQEISYVELMSEQFTKMDLSQNQQSIAKKIVNDSLNAQRELMLQCGKGLLSLEKLAEKNGLLSVQMNENLKREIGELNLTKYRDLISKDQFFKLGMNVLEDKQTKNLDEFKENSNIVSFRGAELFKLEVKVLKEIENLTQLTFSSVISIGDNTQMGFTSNRMRVTGIGLYKCRLTSIPESTGFLSELRVLNLGFNSIRDLPIFFVTLPKLRTLNLEFNQTIFSIPEVIMKMLNLKELNLIGTMASLNPSGDTKKQIRQLKKKGINVKH